MKKEELIRYRAGLAALLVSGSMFLGGCSLGGDKSSEGFELTADKERNFVAQEDSYINNDFIEKCYVVEAKSKITGESDIYITRRRRMCSFDYNYDFIDVFTNVTLFHDEHNKTFEVINQTPLFDYLISLNLVKVSYSYEDMQKIYEEIKEIYEFDNDKKLVK